MSEGRRKFRSNSPAPSKTKKARSPGVSRGTDGRRKARRSPKGSGGVDPFMMAGIVTGILLIMGALVLVAGRGKSVEDDLVGKSKDKTSKGKKSTKKGKFVTAKDPEVKKLLNSKFEDVFSKEQENDLKEMFIVMAKVASVMKKESIPAQKKYLAALEIHEDEDLLRLSDLVDRQEQSRQRALIQSLRKAARHCLSIADRHNARLIEAVRESTLSEKMKTEILKDTRSGKKDPIIVKVEDVLDLCDVELKILTLVQDNFASLSKTEKSTSFTNSALNREYKKLLRKRTEQLEKTANH
ncbi:MAG: hypothetical protein P1V97_14575 [Planctomycetota bacterium]|nr:hypothetical protein [Planctomycetota bacterium]